MHLCCDNSVELQTNISQHPHTTVQKHWGGGGGGGALEKLVKLLKISTVCNFLTSTNCSIVCNTNAGPSFALVLVLMM